jgi:hypothetical protein
MKLLDHCSRFLYPILGLAILVAIVFGFFAILTLQDSADKVRVEEKEVIDESVVPETSVTNNGGIESGSISDSAGESSSYERPPFQLRVSGFKTNTRLASIEPDEILSGGPGKDGIPALHDPKFVGIDDAEVEDEVLGIFVELDGAQKYYPYTILVWHEIVNDSIGDQHFAVTFCPLCGSAIVFDREVDNELVSFGVSGLLYESNLLMYDSVTESLWSQAIGTAVVGDRTGKELERLPMQLITFAELKRKYPSALVLSEDTGYRRNYGFYPYGDYEESDDFVFHPSLRDQRFHPKKIMYVVNVDETSIAFPYEEVPQGETMIKVGAFSFSVVRNGGEIDVRYDDLDLTGYFEMWFSWAVHHQKDGLVWTP